MASASGCKQKSMVVALLLMSIAFGSEGQSILGTWQLVKSTSCIENDLEPGTENEANLLDEMKQHSSPTPQVVRFREKGAGDESLRILNRKKTANARNFLYKVHEDVLLILDKRSQTISDSYNIDKLSADSLILSSSSRSCDIRFFVKIKDPR